MDNHCDKLVYRYLTNQKLQQSLMNQRLWDQEEPKKLAGFFFFSREEGLYHLSTLVALFVGRCRPWCSPAWNN